MLVKLKDSCSALSEQMCHCLKCLDASTCLCLRILLAPFRGPGKAFWKVSRGFATSWVAFKELNLSCNNRDMYIVYEVAGFLNCADVVYVPYQQPSKKNQVKPRRLAGPPPDTAPASFVADGWLTSRS